MCLSPGSTCCWMISRCSRQVPGLPQSMASQGLAVPPPPNSTETQNSSERLHSTTSSRPIHSFSHGKNTTCALKRSSPRPFLRRPRMTVCPCAGDRNRRHNRWLRIFCSGQEDRKQIQNRRNSTGFRRAIPRLGSNLPHTGREDAH